FLGPHFRRLPTATLFPYTTLFRSQHGRRVGSMSRPEYRRRQTREHVVHVHDIGLLGVYKCAQTRLRERVPDASERSAQRSEGALDRKSTRLNSSHASISYAVFCLI